METELQGMRARQLKSKRTLHSILFIEEQQFMTNAVSFQQRTMVSRQLFKLINAKIEFNILHSRDFLSSAKTLTDIGAKGAKQLRRLGDIEGVDPRSIETSLERVDAQLSSAVRSLRAVTDLAEEFELELEQDLSSLKEM